jgi:hypothetical protein
MAIGAKKIETRSWYTTYRGWIAIHAAKKWNKDLEGICFEEPYKSVLEMKRPNMAGCFYYEDALKEILPLGAIVAVAKLDACIQMNSVNIPDKTSNERQFGDYRLGRFMWRTSDVIKLAVPILYRGQQGIFDLSSDVNALLLRLVQSVKSV